MSTMMSSSSTAVAKSQAQVISCCVFPLRIGARCWGLLCRRAGLRRRLGRVHTGAHLRGGRWLRRRRSKWRGRRSGGGH